MLVDPVLSIFYLLLLFPFFLVFDGKRYQYTGKDDLDQQTACKAPAHWSKYTTQEAILRIIDTYTTVTTPFSLYENISIPDMHGNVLKINNIPPINFINYIKKSSKPHNLL